MSLDAIGIVAQNIESSVRFYKILGVDLKEFGGKDHYEGITRNGLRIMLDSVELMKKLNPNWIEPHGVGIILCFKQDLPQDVDELYNELLEAGFRGIKEPWDAFWGQRYSSVSDPNGNQIDIFAQMKAS